MVTPPAAAPGQEPRQRAVYRAYCALQSLGPAPGDGALGGTLLLSTGFGARQSELALAMRISGGAFLGIEPDAATLKLAVRNGSCDFMVNTLDEALRVLKNELRKHAPLTAGLLGEPAEVLTEMVERGVQPDLLAPLSPGQQSEAALATSWHTLAERGARPLPAIAPAAGQQTIWQAETLSQLRQLDQLALSILPAGDTVRHRWLEQAPGYFHRQRPLERVLDLTTEEQAQLQSNAAAAGLPLLSTPFSPK